jgi:glycosyltransferase involved in cell wall biosynthesis
VARIDEQLVSAIVPVYNIEKYLEACVQSIINQSYKNIEVVLVDDKSLDGSGKIADKYAIIDNRVKVVHKKKNEGVNMARATGFRKSSGEYVMFVDGDDMIDPDCVKTAVQALVGSKTDFVRFGMRTYKDKKDLNIEEQYPLVQKGIVLKGKKQLYMTQFNVEKVLGGVFQGLR